MSESVATTALATTAAIAVLSLADPVYLLIGLVSMLLLGVLVSYRQQRLDSLLFALSTFIFFPYVIGQGIVEPNLASSEQAILSTLPVVIMFMVRRLLSKISRKAWAKATSPLLILLTFIAVIFSIFASTIVSFWLIVTMATMYVLLNMSEAGSDWAVASGIVTTGFILKALFVGSNPILTVSFVLAVVWNIALALHFRSEATRWLGSLLWFLLPIIIGVDGFDFSMSAAGYAWAFIVAMVGFMTARAIARGVIAPSPKVAVASYEKQASYVYVLGYTLSGAAALCAAVFSNNTQLQVSLVLASLMVATYVSSRFVEKRSDTLSFIAILAQLLIFSALQPYNADNSIVQLYLGLSSFTALVCYGLSRWSSSGAFANNKAWKTAAVLTLYFAPGSIILFTESYLLMPVTLAVAGVVALVESWNKTQASRESSGLIIALSLLWLMQYFGVDSAQAYTHVIALVFAIYAYWRYLRDDKPTSNSYLRYMFLIATIPLILQALFGRSGDVYGWWLILEQVGFILLGMAIGRRFLIKWGLYVSVAAVLYQMRDLGWAALTVLALFIIGLAMYHLNKQDNDK